MVTVSVLGSIIHNTQCGPFCVGHDGFSDPTLVNPEDSLPVHLDSHCLGEESSFIKSN